MAGYSLTFGSPMWLLLLFVLPMVWWLGRRSLSGGTLWRRGAALILRTLLVLLVVFALAEVELQQTSDRLTVLYVVDGSRSVPAEKLDAAIKYVNAATEKQRDQRRKDRAGVIVFGREAAIEIAPTEIPLEMPNRVEATIDNEGTNLASALRLALASFPTDSAKRVVILSDGNETVGDARAAASLLASEGVGIDVVPLHRQWQQEVAIEKVTVPSDVRRGTPFEVRVVVSSTGSSAADGLTRGRLQVSRVMEGESEVIADQAVSLSAGKHVYAFHEQVDSPAFYTYQARFLPDAETDDELSQNNEAAAFAQVRGKGRVLLVEDWSAPGEFNEFAQRLRKANIEVTSLASNRLYSTLAEFQPYDAVILADVPRSSGSSGDEITQISDEQVELLVKNTQQMASGLIMLGGPKSFGAGGWANTKLEEAMPVEFQIKNAKVVPEGALVLVLDSSGSMSGDKLTLSKSAAAAAVKVLSAKDHVGVVAFDSTSRWIVPPQQIKAIEPILASIRRIGAGGGTDMYPGMARGYQGLEKLNASLKHMVVLSDGQSSPGDFQRLAANMKRKGITTSCVAVGQDAAAPLLNEIATAGGGSFYLVHDPRAIPRIFVKEAMRVARPVVFEDAGGIAVMNEMPHEMLYGLEGDFPPVTGYVMTMPKQNSLIETPLRAAKPNDETNTILATWHFGLGRSVAFTTDAGARWAKAWSTWDGYDRFFPQMVRWAMRPSSDDGKYTLFTDVEDGRVRVIVTALDQNDDFLNFLDFGGAVAGPGDNTIDLKLTQTAPGRYVGEFPADQAGNYFLSVTPGAGKAPLRAGVNVPYSAEFRDQQSNEGLLLGLAALKPKGGEAGEVITEPAENFSPDALATNVFREGLPPARSRQAAWHFFVFAAACLFLADIFQRRVLLGFGWLRPVLNRVKNFFLRRTAEPARTEPMSRLQAMKAKVNQQLDERKAAARFDVELDRLDALDESAAPAPREATPAARPTGITPEAEQESYTSRLLKAKEQARKR